MKIKVQEKYQPTATFPDVEHYKQILGAYNINKFKKLNTKMIRVVDDLLKHDISVMFDKLSDPYE